MPEKEARCHCAVKETQCLTNTQCEGLWLRWTIGDWLNNLPKTRRLLHPSVYLLKQSCIRAHTPAHTNHHVDMLQTTWPPTATLPPRVISTAADALGCILPYVSCATLESPGRLSPGRLLHPMLGSAPTNPSSRN